MTLAQQVCAQARLMAQELAEENQALLEAVCAASASELKGQLRDNVGAEDCLTDFVTAAAMMALATMTDVGSMAQLEHIRAGDLTLRRNSGDTMAQSLRQQAYALMRPYIKAGFSFVGV